MALYLPKAHLARVSFESQLPIASPIGVFLHTNGGGTGPPGIGLHNWWETLWATSGPWGGPHQGIGSHFQVYFSGDVDQYVDTARVIFAQFQASRWSLAIETQDNGDPSVPWSDDQMQAIADLLRWINTQHGIPLVMAPFFGAPGIYYHEEFPQTNFDGHVCPGSVREHQLITELVPSLTAPKDSVMTQFPTIIPGDQTHARFVLIARTAMASAGWPMPITDVNDSTFTGGIKVIQGWAGLAIDGVLGEQTWPAVMKTGVYAHKPLPVAQKAA